MNEEWNPIGGYEGIYEISSLGRVKSLKRKNAKGILLQEKILRSYRIIGNFLVVYLYNDKKYEQEMVHRLVAWAFINNIENKKQVKFLDNDKSNINVNNLEWCHQKDNNNNGHNKGYHHSEETKKKMRQRRLGIEPWNKGMTNCYSEETRKKISNTLKGRKLSEETKMKISRANSGKKLSEEHKKKLSETYREKYKNGYVNNRKGKEVSQEHRRKISESNKGRKCWLEGERHSEESKQKMSNSKMGYKFSEEAKKKMRISRINYIQEIGASNVGQHEEQILNEIELSNNIKIERQYLTCGYLLDGYCESLNIAFEVDEKFHFSTQQQSKDKIRQDMITDELNCIFIRLEDNW